MAEQKLTDKGSLSSLDDLDLIHVVDVSDTASSLEGTSKKGLWSLFKSTLKTYFDTLYSDALKYDTVSDMIIGNPSAGKIVTTLGYTTANDGGGNTYRIVDDASLTQDYGAIINITGNIYAVVVDTKNLTNKHFGIFSDSSTNWASTASARFNGLLDAAVLYGITFESEPNTYFNCELNLDDSHSGAFIHFENAVFSDLIHIVGTDINNKITGMTLTGHLTTYGRYGTTYADNIVGDLNITLKSDALIHPDGDAGRGVHIYHSNTNHNYGNIIVEHAEDAGSCEAAVAIDGITNTGTGDYAPENINIQSIWVWDSDVRGVQITGLNHKIGSIRVDRYGSNTFDNTLPSMNTTTYNGEAANQIAQGVLFLYTNAVVDLIVVDQVDGFTGRSRALTDVAIDRYTLESNPTVLTRTVPTIGTIISKNPQRQTLSVGATQRTSGVSIGHIQIHEISTSNVLEVNASGERADYGLVDCYLGVINIGSIHCYNYRNATLLQQLDQGYGASVEQQVMVSVGSISKEIISTSGKAYDIFQGNINYVLIYNDTNNKKPYHTKFGSTGITDNATSVKLTIGDSETKLTSDDLRIENNNQPTLILNTTTAGQATSGRISFRELASTEEFAVAHDGSANRLDIESQSNAVISILRSSRFVGINKTAPTEQLDVSGNIKATGYKSSDGSTGATGSFTAQSGETITVKNGLITAIV